MGQKNLFVPIRCITLFRFHLHQHPVLNPGSEAHYIDQLEIHRCSVHDPTHASSHPLCETT